MVVVMASYLDFQLLASYLYVDILSHAPMDSVICYVVSHVKSSFIFL